MSNELVRGVETPRDQLAPIANLTGDLDLIQTSKARMVTSLDKTKEDDMRLFFAAQQDSDMNGRDAANCHFPVKHFLLRDATRTNIASKQLEPCLRLTLFTPDGKTFSTTSDVCIQSFLLICAVRGYPPWEPARDLEVVLQKTRGGFSTYKMAEWYPQQQRSRGKSRVEALPGE